MDASITAEEIKSIRKQYGLTQKSFATLLGIGSASMVRYEQGWQPSRANANLIRAACHPEFMAECLERDGELIPKKQREKASRIVYAAVPFGTPDTEKPCAPEAAKEAKHMNKMDEVYHYTLQQEVLNEQAANLSCDLMDYLIAHEIDVSDKSNPVALLLRQVLALKKSLLTPEADDDEFLQRIRGHLSYLGQFVEELTRSEGAA